MMIGDKVKVREPSKGALPSVYALAGQEGVIVEKSKYIGAPLAVRLESGVMWWCWPNELTASLKTDGTK